MSGISSADGRNRKNRVHVYARTRPTANFAHDMLNFRPDGKTIDIHGRKDTKRGVVNNQLLDWHFKVDGILHNASQDEVYENVASRMVNNLLEGYNGTLMCYGQTGAGKTFTMTGATENYKHRGLIPRSLAQVYREVEDRSEHAITVRISYLEIYNETMFDLLSTLPESIQSVPQMTIVEDDQGGVSVKGLSVHLANTEEEALNLLFEGETNRAIAAHSLNSVSSRSHCIFTIHIESRSRTESNAKYIKSKLNLVDLAGSERLGKTGSAGKTAMEAMYINKSLSFLEQTVIALADRKREHIPYRQTKLTHALKDSIGGNCHTIMIANIWGESQQIEETISTLRFATRIMCIANVPSINEYYDPALLVKKLEREIISLKQELAMHDTLTNRSQVSYEPLSDSQLYEIQRQVQRYLEGSLDEIDIVNVRQIQAVFSSFKGMVNQMESQVENKLRAKFTLIDRADPNAIAAAQKAGVVFDENGEVSYVGDVDRQNFGIGIAPSSSKPASSSVVAARRVKSRKSKERASPPSKSGAPSSPVPSTLQTENSSPTRQPPDTRESMAGADATSVSGSAGAVGDQMAPRESTPPLRTVAFEEFKHEKGSEINRILTENKDILSQKKKQCRDLAKTINGTKTEIDTTREALEMKRSDRMEQGEFVNEDGETVIDEEEFMLIKKLKDLKSSYRSDYDELRDVKSEVQYCQKLVDQCRQRLIQEFDTWYSQSFLTTSDEQSSAQAGFGARLGTTYNAEPEDEGERFERLQMELLMENPDSAAFYNAKMRTERRQTYEAAMGQAQPSLRKPGTPTITVHNLPPSMLVQY
ncbi:kinesin-like protein KIF9 [Saccoglossus kowalevskii]|uniref:Kinesin-like protein n=1 Tax=Saccoglossus kowalevskii TaxID=10224 RepID=A0ABM0MJE9_SACKO|nr:PREDICTED: kinesin-like protein KIF9-like isoform X1 [Saccoglossus kowalevskii]XP_006820140.1 PREDICTED: kinesin-like protein KIF9-like isoform X2 [Saccoglossus kowalevskii]